MIRNIIFICIVIAIAATVAYRMGWLSSEGESAYEDSRERIVDESENLMDKARDAIR